TRARRFANQFNLIWPVQPQAQKYCAFHQGQISSFSVAVPLPARGRFAIVTNVGCGMRWTRWHRKTNDAGRGRRSRVVLTPRRWRQVGEDTFRVSLAMVARKPGHQEEHEGNR